MPDINLSFDIKLFYYIICLKFTFYNFVQYSVNLKRCYYDGMVSSISNVHYLNVG